MPQNIMQNRRIKRKNKRTKTKRVAINAVDDLPVESALDEKLAKRKERAIKESMRRKLYKMIREIKQKSDEIV